MSKRRYQHCMGHIRLTVRPLVLCAGACFCADSSAQAVCPSGPVALTAGECHTNGQPIAVTTANGSALNASQAGVITADGSAISLNAAGTTAARASAGGRVKVQGGQITNGVEANLLQGFVATGPGSQIDVAGSSLTFTATARRDNWHGATASNQAAIGLLNTSIALNVGGQGTGTWGLMAETGGAITGDGVDVRLVSDSAANSSSNARGVLARTGGSVALEDSNVLVDYAAGTVGVGLRAEGADSAIALLNGTVTTSARSVRATGAWASGGASIRLSNSQLLANATASTATLTSAALGARVDTGGSLLLDQGTSLLSSGRYNYGIYATDAGSIARLDNASIDVSGDVSRAGIWAVAGAQVEVANASQIVNRSPYTVATYGIYADNLAGAATPTTLRIQDSTIATRANVAGAAIALRYGATAELDNVILETAGSGESIGIWSDNATLTATNITVRTLGERARGVTSDRPTGSTILTGGSIITRGGTEAHALATRLGGNLTGTNLAIQTFGGGQSSGAAADNSLLALNNSTVDVAGPGSYGIWALSEPVSSPEGPALISLDQVQVRTLGDGAFGVVAQRWHQPSPAAVAANALSVDTRGSAAHGLFATSGGEIESRNSRVTTAGSSAFGALAYQHDSRVNIVGTPVGTTGAGAHAAVAYAGGAIAGDQAQLTASGQGAAALLVMGDVDPSTGLVTSAGAVLTSSTLTSVTGPVVGMGGPGSVVLVNSSAGAADNTAVLPWLAVAATSDFPLPVLASPTLPLPVTPDPPDPPDDPSVPLAPAVAAQPRAAASPPVAIAAQAGLADILVQDSVVTGTATTASGSVSRLTLSDSVWNLTGNSNVTHLVNDPSLIDFSAPVGGAFKTLTVQTYAGDGTLALNTFLGDDASPSDRLVTDTGNATAASPLQIKPAGGAGALTLGNGILVIDAINGGTTTPGSFALAGPVVA